MLIKPEPAFSLFFCACEMSFSIEKKVSSSLGNATLVSNPLHELYTLIASLSDAREQPGKQTGKQQWKHCQVGEQTGKQPGKQAEKQQGKQQGKQHY